MTCPLHALLTRVPVDSKTKHAADHFASNVRYKARDWEAQIIYVMLCLMSRERRRYSPTRRSLLARPKPWGVLRQMDLALMGSVFSQPCTIIPSFFNWVFRCKLNRHSNLCLSLACIATWSTIDESHLSHYIRLFFNLWIITERLQIMWNLQVKEEIKCRP